MIKLLRSTFYRTKYHSCIVHIEKEVTQMQQYTPIKSGKVREVYDIGDKLIIKATNRISAFDQILPEKVPDKGIILTQMSRFWFDYLQEVLPEIPNHMISTCILDMPEEFQSPTNAGRLMLVKKLEMIPVECIVRGYITGSGWKSYQKNGTVCDIQLPEGLVESQKIEPIFTPTTKEETGHDKPISYQELEALVGEETARLLKEYSIKLYKAAAEYAEERGIIIADTKFEFGYDENGVITLGDEVLTPDSSRFWPGDTYDPGRPQQSFDKQYLRDWITENRSEYGDIPPIPLSVLAITRKKYVQAFTLLTREVFA